MSDRIVQRDGRGGIQLRLECRQPCMQRSGASFLCTREPVLFQQGFVRGNLLQQEVYRKSFPTGNGVNPSPTRLT